MDTLFLVGCIVAFAGMLVMGFPLILALLLLVTALCKWMGKLAYLIEKIVVKTEKHWLTNALIGFGILMIGLIITIIAEG